MILPLANTLAILDFARRVLTAPDNAQEPKERLELPRTLLMPFVVTALFQIPGALFEIIQATTT